MSFLAEMQRRRVLRVGAGYVVVAFGLIQAADLIMPRLGLPDWTVTLVVVLALLGLPLALVLAWAFDATPEGIRHEGASELRWHLPRGRRYAIAGVLAGLLLLGAGAAALMARRGDPTLSADVVAVLPFAVRGSDDLAYLREGIVSLLSTKLDGAGALRTVDPRALLSRLASTGAQPGDPNAASATAHAFGAARMVLGDLVQGGERVRLTATLYDVGRGSAREIATGTAEGKGADVFALVDSVAAQLLATVDGEASRVRRVAAVTTSSIDAFKAYIEGDNAFRSGHYLASMDALRRAVELDSTFALAWYRLSLAAEYRGFGVEAQDAARRALANAHRLSERDRGMLTAFLAWRDGDSDVAERLYRAHLASYPDEVEAWFELGEVLFHLNPMRGRSFQESEEAFRRVLAFEPGHVAAMIHLARNAYARGDFAQMDSFVAAIEAENADRTIENLALRAFAHRDTAAIRDVLRRIEEGSDEDAGFALWVVGAFGADMEGAEAISTVMVRPGASAELRALGHTTRAFLRAGRGRWRDARSEIAAGRALSPTLGLEYHGALLMLPGANPSRAELERLRADLETMSPDMLDARFASRSSIFAGHEEMHDLIRQFLLALVHADLGDFAAADATARAIDRHEESARSVAFRSDYATAVRARVLLARGRPADALAELQRSSFSASASLYYSPFHNQSIARLMLAETLLALGRYEEALPRYQNTVGSSAMDLALLALAELRQAEIHERLGRRDDAIRHYNVFLELWDRPDPEVAAVREEAVRALARLRSRA